MPRLLDPRFAMLMAIANDPREDADFRATCRRSAEDVARECRFAFAEAAESIGLQVEDTEASAVDDVSPATAGDVEPAPSVQSVDGEPSVDPIAFEHIRDRAEDRSGQIRAALKTDPNRSDRDIAREFDASPTTVGRMRRSLGLSTTARTVTRRGARYAMTATKAMNRNEHF